jgi:hypothetical protein
MKSILLPPFSSFRVLYFIGAQAKEKKNTRLVWYEKAWIYTPIHTPLLTPTQTSAKNARTK